MTYTGHTRSAYKIADRNVPAMIRHRCENNLTMDKSESELDWIGFV
jgi:hypothetical protein